MHKQQQAMNRTIIFQVPTNESISFGSFDSDKEMQICIKASDQEIANFYLTMNEVNDLITHLVDELSYMKEPINVLQP